MKRSQLKSHSRRLGPKMVASAQKAINQYVRVRDRDKPCISCGEYRELQAGHYLTRSELRFDERNIHGQCRHCNIDLSGNRAAYRLGLIDRYGLEYVESIECHISEGKKTLDDLQCIREKYNDLTVIASAELDGYIGCYE